MLKCVRIVISYGKNISHHNKTLFSHIQNNAQSFSIEGSLQQPYNDDKSEINIIACGSKTNIDNFMDTLYKELPNDEYHLEIEPFIKEKDYRGVFRVII